MLNDAVAAIATPPGRGGIGVVRVSGSHLRGMLGGLVATEVIPRHATRADFLDAAGGIIDQGLVLYFPAPHSYTGEDVIELQGHGGPVVLGLLLQRCFELGARAAEPGEFTKRAFLNNKIDLAQAEGVADLINASTVTAARSAVRSLHGEFSQHISGMVQALTQLRVAVEASLDFPEEDIDFTIRAEINEKLEFIQRRLASIIGSSQRGQILREGIRVVLAGHPNVGKSSLLNALAGAECAIVTAVPGTTRDAIKETISIEGVPLHLVDTAGLREPQDAVEKLGIGKTWDSIRTADLVVWVSDISRPETRLVDSAVTALTQTAPCLNVINKVDLIGIAPYRRKHADGNEVAVSAKSSLGIDLLRHAILETVGWRGEGEGVFMARERHMQALRRAEASLAQAGDKSIPFELMAEELRLAQEALGSITGRVSADDLLGKIFSTFCVGK